MPTLESEQDVDKYFEFIDYLSARLRQRLKTSK
jgi:hypothetical protein